MATERAVGVGLLAVAAVIWSTAGLFAKGVEAEAWSVIFWRSVFAAVFSGLYLACRRDLIGEVRRMGAPGWSAAVIGASATAAFLAAFKLTSIANVAFIYATAPFAAAAIAWVWIGETPRPRIMAASLASLGGVSVIVAGSLGGGGLWGDLLALWMTIGMSLWIVIYRRRPDAPTTAPNLVAALMLAPVAMLLGDPFETPLGEIALLAGFALVFTIGTIALAEGARRLPASETALLSALETPLAPIWAYLVLAEAPGAATIIGGAIILTAVLGAQVPVHIFSGVKKVS